MMPRFITRVEYRGLSRNQVYVKASKDYSDNGRCWWVERKILEPIYHSDDSSNWRVRERKKYNTQQKIWRKKRNAEQEVENQETRKKEKELAP
tara:strand:- start:262 stop:540 length:279 start_codon:yes stop_codon:yes gene_type:complete